MPREMSLHEKVWTREEVHISSIVEKMRASGDISSYKAKQLSRYQEDTMTLREKESPPEERRVRLI